VNPWRLFGREPQLFEKKMAALRRDAATLFLASANPASPGAGKPSGLYFLTSPPQKIRIANGTIKAR